MDTSTTVHASLTNSPLDVNAAVEFVTRASGGRAGGISTFVGVTRQDKGSDGAVVVRAWMMCPG